MFVDNLSQFTEAFDIFIVIDTIPTPPACAYRVINDRRFYYKQTYTAAGDSFIEGFYFLVHMNFILVPKPRPRAGLH
jgi:hypothetical protein